ncbi:MAG: hypothetical protein OXR67_00790 [Chloroflexota bacterium]|nr:hypothetical protein [Chloroflexota bacterium]
MHRTTHEFWTHFARLPESVQRSARRNFQRLKDDPRYASLRFKKVGDYWSVRVSRSYRALAVEDGEDFIWVWIGGHEEYDRLIAR